jgi:hypothetical protein
MFSTASVVDCRQREIKSRICICILSSCDRSAWSKFRQFRRRPVSSRLRMVSASALCSSSTSRWDSSAASPPFLYPTLWFELMLAVFIGLPTTIPDGLFLAVGDELLLDKLEGWYTDFLGRQL